MRIARFDDGSGPRLGLVEGGVISPVVLPATVSDADVARFGVVALWLDGAPVTEGVQLEPAVPLATARLLTPVPQPSKIICIGTNYRAHAAEHGVKVPDFPDVFAKFPSALVGPGDAIRVTGLDESTDYEGELCVVIGRRAKAGSSAADALGVVAGYAVANDVSARTWQLRVSQWVTGKSFDTYCPVGPWLVDAASVPDPQALGLATEVNGERLQAASTSEMVFGVADLVAYLSAAITLEPGDLILTGTPEGVGLHQQPPRFLKPGDTVSVSITGIGTLTNPVVAD